MKEDTCTFEELTDEEKKFIQKYRALTPGKKMQLWQELALRGVVIGAADNKDKSKE